VTLDIMASKITMTEGFLNPMFVALAAILK
jgi:hypothetical protein